MANFRLFDWNDIRLIIACAEHGGFAGAATALGLDQTTVSRRVGALEKASGRPLFTRRRSGATPTAAGLALLERARATMTAVSEFEDALNGLGGLAPPTVTIGASEGLLSYTLIPTLLGNSGTPQPVDIGLVRRPLPALTFTTRLAEADIAIVATALGTVPPARGAVHVRRIGTMHFRPVAGQAFLQSVGNRLVRFDDIENHPVVNISIYGAIRSLEEWNGLVARHSLKREALVVPATMLAHRALVEGRGVGLLPSYSPLYDERVVTFEFPTPQMACSLWLIAHEDKLREPAVRGLYDTIAELFLTSPWFRERA
jgi:DNA-binding transcriptional LysR family regulator